jgi:peroxisomal 3,2-trans-enoyl-CoA isomerase
VTLTMNNPRRLNGWTQPMMESLNAALEREAGNPDTGAVILTGADPYYCAGVNLAGTLSIQHPGKMRAMIIEHNQALFDRFIDFPKPILVAANGPGLGAAVTSATLCDGIIASDKATFSTPFARLGVSPEGCSSVLFAKLMGQKNADRMLGKADWAPTAAEALAAGLVQWMVPHDTLLAEAQSIAEGWLAEGRVRTYRGEMTCEELKAINARESVALADSFLAAPFLKGQFTFLWAKKKRGPAAMFLSLWLSRPLWSRLL